MTNLHGSVVHIQSDTLLGPVGKSAVALRFFHLATVF